MNNPEVNLGVSIVALAANVAALAYIVYRAKKLGVNPYKQEVFVGTKDFQKAMERRADTAYLLETEPASATAAEIAEMVAYNELPADRHPWLRLRRRGEGRAVVIWLAKLAFD